MATKLNDLPSNLQLATAYGPAELADEATGTTVDMAGGDGPAFAILHIGDVPDGETVELVFHESADGSNWSDDAPGHINLSPASAGVWTFPIRRTQRYLQVRIAVSAATTLGVVFGQPRKEI